MPFLRPFSAAATMNSAEFDLACHIALEEDASLTYWNNTTHWPHREEWNAKYSDEGPLLPISHRGGEWTDGVRPQRLVQLPLVLQCAEQTGLFDRLWIVYKSWLSAKATILAATKILFDVAKAASRKRHRMDSSADLMEAGVASQRRSERQEDGNAVLSTGSQMDDRPASRHLAGGRNEYSSATVHTHPSHTGQGQTSPIDDTQQETGTYSPSNPLYNVLFPSLSMASEINKGKVRATQNLRIKTETQSSGSNKPSPQPTVPFNALLNRKRKNADSTGNVKVKVQRRSAYIIDEEIDIMEDEHLATLIDGDETEELISDSELRRLEEEDTRDYTVLAAAGKAEDRAYKKHSKTKKADKRKWDQLAIPTHFAGKDLLAVKRIRTSKMHYRHSGDMDLFDGEE
ncbi:hypothetical protein MMC25_005646 [Agyrium rufum]|nr:hypothetical protein [Agyrium rufum]